MTKPSVKRNIAPQTGFTLVELMVGMVIGLLATIIIMQVISVFEAQKRVTTGTSDAQTSGNIALYELQRELQIAGFALYPFGQNGVPDSPLDCTTTTYDSANTGVSRLFPVTITEGGAASSSDQITIRYGDAPAGGTPVQITATPFPSASSPAPAQDIPVTSSFGCQANNVALIINGSNCALARLAAPSAIPNATTVTLANDQTITLGVTAVNANLACLGNWTEATYAVNKNTATLERTAGGVTTPLVGDIVSLQAQYGVSAAANSNQVVQWVDAAGVPWGNPTVAQRKLIKAIRVAIVARSQKLESTAVTSACSSLTASAPSGLCAWDATSANPQIASQAPLLDLSIDYPNWDRYRYRVFETIIPLRNVIWSKGTL